MIDEFDDDEWEHVERSRQQNILIGRWLAQLVEQGMPIPSDLHYCLSEYLAEKESEEQWEKDMTEDLENDAVEETEEDNGEENMSRKTSIIEWLSQSPLAKPLKGEKGFFIMRGQKVKLQDGAVVDVLDWLFDEGIKGEQSISEYNVVYTPPSKRYVEKLSFFKSITEAPFSSNKDGTFKKGDSENESEDLTF